MNDLTTREACERLGVDRSTIIDWEKKGYIRSWQVGTGRTCPKRWPLEEIKRIENSWKKKKVISRAITQTKKR